jgi:hypothetical protein
MSVIWNIGYYNHTLLVWYRLLSQNICTNKELKQAVRNVILHFLGLQWCISTMCMFPLRCCILQLPLLGQYCITKDHKNGFTYLNYEYFWFSSQRAAFFSCKGQPQVRHIIHRVICMKNTGSYPMCQHCHQQTVCIRVVLFSYWSMKYVLVINIIL